MSYELLYSLNEGMELLMTGPDTNPTTLSNALQVLQTSLDLYSMATPPPTNITITALNRVMVTPSDSLLLKTLRNLSDCLYSLWT